MKPVTPTRHPHLPSPLTHMVWSSAPGSAPPPCGPREACAGPESLNPSPIRALRTPAQRPRENHTANHWGASRTPQGSSSLTLPEHPSSLGPGRTGEQSLRPGWPSAGALLFTCTHSRHGERQGGLACCNPWGREESDTTGRLHGNNALQPRERPANEATPRGRPADEVTHSHFTEGKLRLREAHKGRKLRRWGLSRVRGQSLFPSHPPPPTT